ncbi:MAG TPA: RIP metalloprotease RseP [Clostridiales bacterium]|nr:RIP metalloprotease RseP [Clostridiales bacterium]
MGIVVGILILSLMMFVHELGHYLTGRRLGFKIEEFSIFMGPVLFSWERQGIKYSLKLLPIGASVRFAGEYVENDDFGDDPGHFFNRPKWARTIVIATGPALNLLSGVLAFLIMFASFGYTVPVISQVNSETQAAAAGLAAGDRIVRAAGKSVATTLDYTGLVLFVAADDPLEMQVRGADGAKRTVVLQPVMKLRYRLGITVHADAAQKGAVIEAVDAASNLGQPVLQAGDILLAVNDIPYEDGAAFAAAVQASAGQPIELTVTRAGETIKLSMVATQYEELLTRGVYFQTRTEFWPAVGQSFQWSWSIIKVTLRSFGMLFTGTLRAEDALSGPIGVVTMISDVVTEKQPLSDKIINLLWMFALVSVSLGFMNLLPIPPLDGNHLLLICIEAIRGKRLSVKTQNLIGIVGIVLIVLLALAGLYFDVLRLIAR